MTSDPHADPHAAARAQDGAAADTLRAAFTHKRPLLEQVSRLFRKAPEGELLVPALTPDLLTENFRITWSGEPFKLTMGNAALEFHPDLPLTGNQNDGNREWIVHAGAAFYEGVPQFIRIRPGKTVILGRADEVQARIFDFDGSVASRHARISNRKGELTIEPLELDHPISVSTITSSNTVWAARRENLLRLPGVLGGPLAPFDDDKALDIIHEVNGLLATEVYREKDEHGVPGGILRIPEDKTAVILGDIHARPDNVLRIITEGGLLSALERGEACLIFLGDLIHSQESGELEDMSSTVLILDLFAMLKRRFPENVFYIRGNHESFSPNVGKGGVPQGVLLRKHLKERRGKAFVTEIENLFNSLAFVVQGNGFAACHAAPVRSTVNRFTLVNIQRYPGIQAELVWNRLRQTNRPAGYGKGSVKRFRIALDLPKHAPLIVAHTPLSTDETLWLNVGDIKGHHVVYSAHTHRAAAMTISGGTMTPLEFIPEPALEFVNSEHDAKLASAKSG